jgi:hypothetical protein
MTMETNMLSEVIKNLEGIYGRRSKTNFSLVQKD